MNLNFIISNLDNEKYRSKEMLMYDLKQIELNCIEFNEQDSPFSKDAHKLYENLKKQLEQFSQYRLRSMPQRGASIKIRGISNASDPSEPKTNKRNPKKSNNKRSLRKRQDRSYEEDKYSDDFKKPTPQKYQKIDEEDENDYIRTQDNFKIQLDTINSNTGVRRSTRSRIPVIDENLSNCEVFVDNIETKHIKTITPAPPSKTNAKPKGRKRNKDSSESDQDYEPVHTKTTRAATKGKVKKPNYKDDSESEDEYIDDDDDDY